MTCEHCAKAITRALSKVAGVTGVTGVDVAKGEAQIEGNFDADAVLAAVAAEGYDVTRIVRRLPPSFAQCAKQVGSEAYRLAKPATWYG